MAVLFAICPDSPGNPVAFWDGIEWGLVRTPQQRTVRAWWKIRHHSLRRQLWRALSTMPVVPPAFKPIYEVGLWLSPLRQGWILWMVSADDLPSWARRLPDVPPPACAVILARALEDVLPIMEVHLA